MLSRRARGRAAWQALVAIVIAACGSGSSRSDKATPTPEPVVEDRGRLAIRAPVDPGPASAQPHARPLPQFAMEGETMALSADGRLMVEAGGPNQFEVRLWDVDAGAYRAFILLEGRTAAHLSWYGDQPVIVTSGGKILLWDLEREVLRRIPGASCRPDLVSAGDGKAFGVAGPGCVSLYEDGHWIRLALPGLARALSLAFDPHLVAVAGTGTGGAVRGWVWARDLDTAGQPGDAEIPPGAPGEPARAEEEVGDGPPSQGTASEQGSAQPLDQASGHPAGTTPAPTPPVPTPTPAFPERPPLEVVVPASPGAPGGKVPAWMAVGCGPGRVYLATGQGRILTWLTRGGSLAPGPAIDLPPGVSDVRFPPGTGRFLALTARGEILSGDLDAARIRWRGELPDHEKSAVPRFLAVAPGGERAAVDLGRPTLLDLAEWRLPSPLPAVRPATVTTLLWNHRLEQLIEVAVVPHDQAPGLAVVVWPATGGARPAILFLEQLASPEDAARSIPMALSADGRRVAVGTAGHVYVIDAEAGARYSRVAVSHTVALSFHADGESIYTVDENGEVRRFEIAGDEGGEVVTRYGERLTAVAGSVTEGLLAVGLARHGRTPPMLEFLASERRQVVRRVRLPAEVAALQAAPAGATIAGVLARGGIRAWRMPRGTSLGRLTRARANAFALDAPGRYLVFGRTDLRSWRVGSRKGRPSGRRLAWTAGELTAVAASPKAACVAGAEASGLVGIYDRRGRRRATLVLVDADRWLAYTEDGAFAGTPAAFSLLRLRSGKGTLARPDIESGLHDPARVWRAIRATCRGK